MEELESRGKDELIEEKSNEIVLPFPMSCIHNGSVQLNIDNKEKLLV